MRAVLQRGLPVVTLTISDDMTIPEVLKKHKDPLGVHGSQAPVAAVNNTAFYHQLTYASRL